MLKRPGVQLMHGHPGAYVHTAPAARGRVPGGAAAAMLGDAAEALVSVSVTQFRTDLLQQLAVLVQELRRWARSAICLPCVWRMKQTTKRFHCCGRLPPAPRVCASTRRRSL